MITQKPQNINVVINTDSYLECNGTASPNPVIVWWKDGSPIQGGTYSFDLNNYYLYSRLNISRAKVIDEGVYKCEYTNIYGSTFSDNVTVIVYRKYQNIN